MPAHRDMAFEDLKVAKSSEMHYKYVVIVFKVEYLPCHSNLVDGGKSLGRNQLTRGHVTLYF